MKSKQLTFLLILSLIAAPLTPSFAGDCYCRKHHCHHCHDDADDDATGAAVVITAGLVGVMGLVSLFSGNKEASRPQTVTPMPVAPQTEMSSEIIVEYDYPPDNRD